MIITPAFQAGDAGLIPATRSIVKVLYKYKQISRVQLWSSAYLFAKYNTFPPRIKLVHFIRLRQL